MTVSSEWRLWLISYCKKVVVCSLVSPRRGLTRLHKYLPNTGPVSFVYHLAPTYEGCNPAAIMMRKWLYILTMPSLSYMCRYQSHLGLVVTLSNDRFTDTSLQMSVKWQICGIFDPTYVALTIPQLSHNYSDSTIIDSLGIRSSSRTCEVRAFPKGS